jgi:hypothetical protein
MKISLGIVVCFLVSSAVSPAASLTVDNLVDLNFTTSDGTPLDASYTAKIGYSTSDIGAGVDYASLLAGWVSAGDITFATGAFATGDDYGLGYNGYGYFSGDVYFNDAAGLVGKNVFVWVTDGGSYNLLLESTAIQFHADWFIPYHNHLSIGSDTLDDFSLILGSYDPDGTNPIGSGGSLVVVPEPSPALLGAIGVLGLLRHRRI